MLKKVFVRSGIRYDYLMYDKDDTFFRELVQHHISGQLKVAPDTSAIRSSIRWGSLIKNCNENCEEVLSLK